MIQTLFLSGWFEYFVHPLSQERKNSLRLVCYRFLFWYWSIQCVLPVDRLVLLVRFWLALSNFITCSRTIMPTWQPSRIARLAQESCWRGAWMPLLQCVREVAPRIAPQSEGSEIYCINMHTRLGSVLGEHVSATKLFVPHWCAKPHNSFCRMIFNNSLCLLL